MKNKNKIVSILNILIIIFLIGLIVFWFTVSKYYINIHQDNFESLTLFYINHKNFNGGLINDTVLNTVYNDINFNIKYNNERFNLTKYEYIKIVHAAVLKNFKYEKNKYDCKFWTMTYIMFLKKLNINYYIINNNEHVFLVAFHENGYCFLDQTIMECNRIVTS